MDLTLELDEVPRESITRPREFHAKGPLQVTRIRAHDHDPIRQRDRLGHRVRDEDDGLLAGRPDSKQLGLHAHPRLLVQGAERLVHEQDHRVDRQRPRDCDPLLHTPRKLERVLVLEPFKVDQIDQVFRDLSASVGRDPLLFASELDILPRREPRKQPEVLEDDALAGARPLDLDPVDEDASRGWLQEARDHVHQRRLAASGPTHDANELIFPNLEVDVRQRVHYLTARRIERFRHPLNRNFRRSVRGAPS